MSSSSSQQTTQDNKSESTTKAPEQPTQGLEQAPVIETRAPGAILPQALANPGSIGPNDVLQLQRAGGNQAVSQLLGGRIQRMEEEEEEEAMQAKSEPGRIQRQEEEEEEEAVQAKSEPGRVQRQEEEEEEEAVQAKSEPGRVQRQEEPEEEEEEEEPVQAKSEVVQRECSECEEEEPLQMKAANVVQRRGVYTLPAVQRSGGKQGGGVSANVESGIQGARGSGNPLPKDVRGSMEQSMGADFSGVRIHTGGQADSLNRSIQARAFTTGNDVFFRSGEYNPGSRAGKELLAHELTHTIQQGASSQVQPKRIQAKLALGPVNDKYEQEADAVAKKVVNQDSQSVTKNPAKSSLTPQSIQRMEPGHIQRWSLGGLLKKAKSKVSSAWGSVKSSAKKAWSGVKSTATKVVSGVKSGVSSAVGKAKEVWGGVKSTASKFVSGVKSKASSAWGKAKSVWGGIKSKASKAWSGIKSKAKAAWGGAKNTLASLKAKAESLIDTAKTGIQSTWEKAKGGAKALFNKVKGGAKSLWNKAKNGVLTALDDAKTMYQQAKSKFKSMWGKAKAYLKSSYDQAKNKAKSLWGKAKALWSTAKNGLMSGWNNLKNWARGTWNNLKLKARALKDKIIGTIKAKVTGWVRKIIDSLCATAKPKEQMDPTEKLNKDGYVDIPNTPTKDELNKLPGKWKYDTNAQREKFQGEGSPQLAESMKGLFPYVRDVKWLNKSEDPKYKKTKELTDDEKKTVLTLLMKLASARKMRPSDAIRQYDKMIQLRADGLALAESKNNKGANISTEYSAVKEDKHKGFWASSEQLAYGKIVGDNLGLDPTFASMLNPTGGLVGPGGGSLFMTDGAVAQHGIDHDAGGYLRNFHDIGPGYQYQNDATSKFIYKIENAIGLSSDHPFAGQVAGVLAELRQLTGPNKGKLGTIHNINIVGRNISLSLRLSKNPFKCTQAAK